MVGAAAVVMDAVATTTDVDVPLPLVVICGSVALP